MQQGCAALPQVWETWAAAMGQCWDRARGMEAAMGQPWGRPKGMIAPLSAH